MDEILPVLVDDFEQHPKFKEIWEFKINESSAARVIFELIPADGAQLARAVKYIDIDAGNLGPNSVRYQNQHRHTLLIDLCDPNSLIKAEEFIKETLKGNQR